MKNTRPWLCFMLSGLLILMMSIAASAEGDFTFTQEEQGVISEYNGEGGDVTVPAQIDGKPVRVLPNAAFGTSENGQVTSITCESGLVTFEDYAVYNLPNLSAVTLPDTLQVLGMRNLALCPALTSVTLPASLRLIGRYSLSECESLREIVFTGVVIDGAFYAFEE